jgi:hypothetical protein
MAITVFEYRGTVEWAESISANTFKTYQCNFTYEEEATGCRRRSLAGRRLR